jgi:hypothetical protein
MLRRLIVLALLCLPAFPQSLRAQVMTLDQALAEAQRVNPQVRAARFRWISAQH